MCIRFSHTCILEPMSTEIEFFLVKDEDDTILSVNPNITVNNSSLHIESSLEALLDSCKIKYRSMKRHKAEGIQRVSIDFPELLDRYYSYSNGLAGVKSYLNQVDEKIDDKLELVERVPGDHRGLASYLRKTQISLHNDIEKTLDY